MTNPIIIEADGGSRGNPGSAGSGAILLDSVTGAVLGEIALYIGVATNNVAEYRAVLAAIELANEIAPEARLFIRMDSKLVVEQMSGRWKIKHDAMSELSVLVAKAIGKRQVDFEWIPREQNTRADALANEAMDAEKSVVRKFVSADDTQSIQVISSLESASSLEYNSTLPSSVRAPKNVKSPLTTLIMVRHGRTALTETHRLSGRGGEDPQLSELGVLDASNVAAELLKVGVTGFLSSVEAPAVIVSSPIRRTRQTAEIIGKQLGLPVEVEEDIAEISFGEWDGHTNAEVQQKWPVEFENWKGDISIAPPGGGESLEEFDKRVQEGRKRILSKYSGQTVIVVSHVMPIRGFIKTAFASDWPSYWRISVAPCSMTVLRFWGEEAAEVTCTNYVGHL